MSGIYPVEKFRRVAEYKQTLLLLIIIKLLNLNLKKKQSLQAWKVMEKGFDPEKPGKSCENGTW